MSKTESFFFTNFVHTVYALYVLTSMTLLNFKLIFISNRDYNLGEMEKYGHH